MSTCLQILYASHGYKPAYRVGGPIISIAAVAERLVRRGHRVTVFTSNSNLDQDLDIRTDQPVMQDGVEVWYFKRKEYLQEFFPSWKYLSQSMGFLYAPRMKWELTHMLPRVDLVHAQIPFVYPSMICAKMGVKYHKPVFYHQRGVFHPNRIQYRSLKKKLYIQAVEKPIMRNATTLIALNTEEEEDYRALGIKTPIRIVPNGIDVDQYWSVPKAPFEQPLNIPSDARVVLFMSRIHPKKGGDALVKAFLKVHQNLPDAVLVMAGPDESDLIGRFQSEIQKAGVHDRILFPGMISGDLKKALLARADLFCLPSAGEGFSIALLEALASQTPILITPGCRFSEAEQAGAGVVTSSDPDILAKALGNLLSEPEELRKMGQRGFELVSAHYSWDSIVDRMLEVYEEGIQRHRAACSSALRPSSMSRRIFRALTTY